MTNHAERELANHVTEPTSQVPEPANQLTELTADEMERVSGGFLAFTFKLVAVKTVSW
jgi:hypothetical protein